MRTAVEVNGEINVPRVLGCSILSTANIDWRNKREDILYSLWKGPELLLLASEATYLDPVDL